MVDIIGAKRYRNPGLYRVQFNTIGFPKAWLYWEDHRVQNNGAFTTANWWLIRGNTRRYACSAVTNVAAPPIVGIRLDFNAGFVIVPACENLIYYDPISAGTFVFDMEVDGRQEIFPFATYYPLG